MRALAPKSSPKRRLRRGAAVCAVVLTVAGLLVWGGHLGMGAVSEAFDLRNRMAADVICTPIFWALLLGYVVLTMIPFVPGAELGILLLVALGAEAAGHVYLATVTALLLAYGLGWFCPAEALRRRCAAVLSCERASGDNVSSSPRPFLRRVGRYRCCTLAVLLNTPGNSVLGGGGGIAFTAGLSRTIPVSRFFLTVAIAVAPVPTAVLLGASLPF